MAQPENNFSEAEFEEVARRLDALVREFEALPYPEVRAKVFDLLQTIDSLHRAGLTRLAAFLQNQGRADLLDQAAGDPVVLTLLQLYGLAPLEPQEQVIMALEELRDYLTEQGCLVELLEVSGGVVHIRFSGAGQGRSESAAAIRARVETALREGFSGFRAMEVYEPPEQLPPPPARSIIPLQQLQKSARHLKRPVFTPVLPLDDLPDGELRAVEAAPARVLLGRVEDEIFAFHNACPGSPLPLDLGRLEGTNLHCPWHGCVFDLRSGRRLDGGPGRLAVVPVVIRDGVIQLALTTES